MSTLEESDKQIEATKKRLKFHPPPPIDYTKALCSGITVFNLAMTGRPDFAILPGYCYMFIGESHSLKTWLLKQLMAEATLNPVYVDYRIVLDNANHGDLGSTAKYFGTQLAARLEYPSGRGVSTTVEEFYDHIADFKNVPCIYGLDDEDSLSCETDLKKDASNKNFRRKKADKKAAKLAGGEKVKETVSDSDGGDDDGMKGNMGMAKAKYHSTHLRDMHNTIAGANSIFIMVKQTRMNTQMFARNPETYSGGKGLKYYATNDVWFSVAKKIKKIVNSKPRVIGTKVKIHIEKNRIWGRDRTVEVIFYPSVGISEIDTNINFMVEENKWNEKGKDDYHKVVNAPEFEFEGSRDDLALKIIAEGQERKLASLVSELWQEIEMACNVQRPNRYTAVKT